MGETAGVGPASKEPQIGGPAKGGPSGGGQTSMDVKASTMGELKQALIAQYGEEKGKKIYDTLVKMIADTALSSIQSAASQAQQAAKKMSQTE